jgi:hypothetical protein
MSLEFVKRKSFAIVRDDVHAVRFPNESLQGVVGRVTVPLSFGNGRPSGTLVKLVNQFSETQNDGSDDTEVDEESSHLYNTTIAVEFYVLYRLKKSIILGDDLLVSVNSFVSFQGISRQSHHQKAPTQRLQQLTSLKKLESVYALL